MNGSCSEKAVRRFNEVLEKTIKSSLTRSYTKKAIDKAIKDLSFLHEGLKLTHNDPSYVFRYLYAIKFWKEESKEEKIEDKSRSESLKKELIKQLKQKENLFLDADGQEFVDSFDGLTNLAASRADTRHREQLHGYITTITQTKVFVKPVDEPRQPPERELEVGNDEILSFSYGFIYPGDKVEVSAFASHNGIGRNLTILKSTNLSSKDETEFIQQFKNSLLSEDSDAFSIFNEMCERSKGIWDYITNDESVQENTENMKDILKVSSLLSEKLSKGKETSCQIFLESLASSAFFVKLLPDFIKVSVKDKDSDETRDIATLLKLMVKLSPSSSKNVFKLAHCLGKQLIDSRPDVRGGATTNHNNCHWSTRLLADLGATLTRHVPGSQEVASDWHELPTILTQKEIFPGETEHDISDLEAIKRDKPYESTCQYLEINYRLLREECFRNLYTGIRKFCESPEEYDPRKIKMFKIRLHDICLPSDSEVTIRLKYKAYKEVGNQDSEEETKGELYGNLMCISFDKKFKCPVWATIGNFPPEERLKYSNTKIVCVKLCSERNTMDDAKVLLKLQELTEKGDHALMAESPTFFQAFGPSMERLQEAQRSDNMPFEEEIIHAKKSKAPEYTEDKKQKDCDWGIIFKEQKGCKFEVPKDEDFSPLEMYKFLRKEKTPSELDETQLLAIQNFLERRVALIQGPPGTGKSFLGTKIVRLMLSMEIQKRYNGPILVMTYKNVALDHFLKTCMEYCPKVLRIGRAGRDTSDELKEINLSNARKKVNLKKSLIEKRKKVNMKMKSSQSKLTTAFKNLTNPLFTLKLFLQAAEKSHVRSLLTESPDKNQNDEENSKVEDLLSEWGKTGAEDCSAHLKDMVKISLNKWLPKQKLKEKYQSYSENKVESEIQNKNRCLR